MLPETATNDQPKQFKVIIIGGGIAGLTLAHALDRAGISYTLLEKHHDFRPRLGGVLVIAPSGARIIEQLGLYEKLREVSEPITTPRTGFPDVRCSSQRWLPELERRYGYPVNVITRQKMLEVLYDGLRESANVLGGKRVTGIYHKESGVAVHTADGGVYEGDLVVGADGVKSIARLDMLRAAGQSAMKEAASLASDYRVFIGMSKRVPGIHAGEQIVRCHDGFAIFVFCGKDSEIGWFVVDKLDRRYQYPEKPAYSTTDNTSFCESIGDAQIWEEVQFSDIFKSRTSFSTALVEENVFQTWHHGRIVCIGDSISKASPNTGLGASMAMESAAALASQLHQLVHCTQGKPSDAAVDNSLSQLRRSHYQRCRIIGYASYEAIRLHTRATFMKRLAGPLFMTSERMALLFQSMVADGGAKLDFLPLPRRGAAWGETKQAFLRLRSIVMVGAPLVLLLLIQCVRLMQGWPRVSDTT